jgi:hypothetical protein
MNLNNDIAVVRARFAGGRGAGRAPPDFWHYDYRNIPRPLWPWDGVVAEPDTNEDGFCRRWSLPTSTCLTAFIRAGGPTSAIVACHASTT